jgi:siroheme decarboxylase
MSKPTKLDETDKKILQLLQDNFPMVERPYKHVGKQVGLTEEQVLNRLKQLNQQGITRKIGATIDRTKIGLPAATLVAFKVPPERVDAVSDVINQYPEVSHNYEREHEYNVWFTLKAHNQSELKGTLEEIAQRAAVISKDILDLPTKNCFKINVRFQMV